MAVVDSHVFDKNREGFREVWSIWLGGEIDGILEDTDVHHWDEVLETSLFGMEQYLDTYNNGAFVNGDTAIYEELYHPFLPSLTPPEDSNSEMTFIREDTKALSMMRSFLLRLTSTLTCLPTYQA